MPPQSLLLRQSPSMPVIDTLTNEAGDLPQLIANVARTTSAGKTYKVIAIANGVRVRFS